MNSRWGTSLAIPSTPEGFHEWPPKTRLTVLRARWWLVSHQGKAKSPRGAHHGKRPQALGVFFHFSSWFLCEVGIYYPHLTDKEIRLETQEPASQHRTNKQHDWGCSWHQPSDGSWSGVSQHLIKKLCKHTKSGPSSAKGHRPSPWPPPSFVQCVLFAEADKTSVSLPGKPMAPEWGSINVVLTYLKSTRLWNLNYS